MACSGIEMPPFSWSDQNCSGVFGGPKDDAVLSLLACKPGCPEFHSSAEVTLPKGSLRVGKCLCNSQLH